MARGSQAVPIAEATVVGDFRDGTKFADHGRSYTFGSKDGQPFVSVAFGGRTPETFNVDYTLGAKRYQGYLATLPEGRIYVLPVFWDVASKRWIDWKEITSRIAQRIFVEGEYPPGTQRQTSFEGGSTNSSTNVPRGNPDRRTTAEPSSNARRTSISSLLKLKSGSSG